MTCRTCFWWTNGECHKGAPITYPIVTRPGDCDRTARPVWPETQSDAFCGDYKPAAAPVVKDKPFLQWSPPGSGLGAW